MDQCKVILYDKKRYCILANELEKKEKYYILPELDILIDENSRQLFLYGGYKAFVAQGINPDDLEVSSEDIWQNALGAPKKIKQTTAGGYLYALVPIDRTEIKEYISEKKQLEPYESKLLGEGEYGMVTSHVPQNIARKRTEEGEVSQSSIKEIAVYSLLQGFSCLPNYYGFKTELSGMELFMEKGAGVLQDILQTKIPEHLWLTIMLKLLKCM